MTANDSANRGPWIVTIHDKAPQGFLSFDIEAVLHCLGPNIHGYLWVITELNCTGKEAQSLCDASQKGPGARLVLPWSELLAACTKFGQTVDATLIGVPQRHYIADELAVLSDIGRFPETEAQLVIRAVDSSFFEVLTKNYQHVQAIKHRFKDTRQEDASRYFIQPSER